jgi:hypothetical protein
MGTHARDDKYKVVIFKSERNTLASHKGAYLCDVNFVVDFDHTHVGM